MKHRIQITFIAMLSALVATTAHAEVPACLNSESWAECHTRLAPQDLKAAEQARQAAEEGAEKQASERLDSKTTPDCHA